MRRNADIQFALLALVANLWSGLAPSVSAQDFAATAEPVGRGTNGIVTPVNQRLTPAGTQLELPGMRPEAVALSPNGKLLVTAGFTHELMVINPATGLVTQRVTFPAAPAPKTTLGPAPILDPDDKTQISYTGLIFSPDGTRIYVSDVTGTVKEFNVAADGTVTAATTFPLPLVHLPAREAEIPAGLAISPDGRKLYVALNLSNRLAEMDTATGEILRSWDVGVAPFGVALAGGKVWVSNWGGRRPAPDSRTATAGHGTLVRVDERAIASEGSVSSIDLATTNQTEILTGLHTCALGVEDDPQNGWDHVSGYRTTSYVISPYTKRHTVVRTQYNQTSLLRTKELILGLPPMNQMDVTATPMFDCFINTPDFTPYTAVPNQVPLDQMNPRAEAITDPVLRRDAQVSARLNVKQEDQCPEDLLNRILWRSVKGTQAPYPEWAVKIVNDD